MLLEEHGYPLRYAFFFVAHEHMEHGPGLKPNAPVAPSYNAHCCAVHLCPHMHNASVVRPLSAYPKGPDLVI